MRYELSHLESESDPSVQPDEALLLYSMVKVMSPKTIVEFGFLNGYSARNFLKAMPADCKLYSFDPKPLPGTVAQFLHDTRFKFLQKKGEDFFHSDIDNALIDMAFIDASHEFESNVKIFSRIKKYLSDNCVVAVHDTGLFNKDFMDGEWNIPGSFYVGENGFAHQPQERLFVNYLKRKNPKFGQIHFHSMNVRRKGLTILQRYKKLPLGTRNFLLWLKHLKIIRILRNQLPR